MKILFVNTFYAPDEVGGAEKSVRFLAEAMVHEGHEAMVVALGRQQAIEEIGGVRVERLPVANLYHPLDAAGQGALHKLIWHALDTYNIKAGKLVAESVKRFRPDVVHTNNISGFSVAVWSAVAELGVPIVHTLRDYYLLCPNTAMFRDGAQCVTRCTRCQVLSMPRKEPTAYLSTVVGNSRFILDRHLDEGLFQGVRREVIYNAYEPKGELQDLRNTTHLTFGFIGRLTETKGVGMLIDAFREILLTRPEARLLIAGEGEPDYVDRLRARSSGLPVEFLGRVDPEYFYSRLDWCVVPSLWHEPLARVLFESFTHGVPVIATPTGGSPELVRDGETGFLCAGSSLADLTKAMGKACVSGDRYRKFSETVRSESARFRPHEVVRQYRNLYETVRESS